MDFNKIPGPLYSSSQNEIFQACDRINFFKITEEMWQELNIKSVLNRITQYQLKWLECLTWLGDCHIPKQLVNYKTKVHRSVWHPKKHWSVRISISLSWMPWLGIYTLTSVITHSLVTLISNSIYSTMQWFVISIIQLSTWKSHGLE